MDVLLQCVTADLVATHHQVYIATAGSVMKCVHTTLVAIDETNIVAVDLTNVCESRDSQCSLVFSGQWTHAHHHGLSWWLSKLARGSI